MTKWQGILLALFGTIFAALILLFELWIRPGAKVSPLQLAALGGLLIVACLLLFLGRRLKYTELFRFLFVAVAGTGLAIKVWREGHLFMAALWAFIALVFAASALDEWKKLKKAASMQGIEEQA